MFCERGYPGSVLLTRTAAGALYVVRVGPYASEADAGRVAARLRMSVVLRTSGNNDALGEQIASAVGSAHKDVPVFAIR